MKIWADSGEVKDVGEIMAYASVEIPEEDGVDIGSWILGIVFGGLAVIGIVYTIKVRRGKL